MRRPLKIVSRLALIFLLSIGLITGLFLMSEDMMQHSNSFVRRFPHAVVTKEAEADLKFSGYYFAGISNDKVYLANYTAPLQLIVAEKGLRNIQRISLKINDDHYPFRSVEVKVLPPFFYIMDGTVPIIFKGNVSDWQAHPLPKSKHYFLKAEPADGNIIAFREQQQSTGENILGTYSYNDSMKVEYTPEVLQKQIDGFFDNDGTIQYSRHLKKFVYVCRYRNQYIVTDEKLKVDLRGKTIDTTSIAKLKVVSIESKGIKKLGAPPYTVNAYSAVYDHLLFINSGLRGKYETSKVWNQNSVVDVYDFVQNTYLLSFYVNKIGREKISGMTVWNDKLYVIIDHYLQEYQLGKPVMKKLKKK